MAFNFHYPSYGAAVMDGNVTFVLAQNAKEVHKITLPTEPPKKVCILFLLHYPFSKDWLQETSKDSFLEPAGEFPGHMLPGGKVKLSPHFKWLASIGRDGIITVRAVGALVSPFLCDPFVFHILCFTL
jgi:hypothetical protein